jgi:hypothetical protein
MLDGLVLGTFKAGAFDYVRKDGRVEEKARALSRAQISSGDLSVDAGEAAPGEPVGAVSGRTPARKTMQLMVALAGGGDFRLSSATNAGGTSQVVDVPGQDRQRDLRDRVASCLNRLLDE